MNWEALGAIGEIVGAIAVVVTLGYLAVQIRQNTRSVRASTYQSITSFIGEMNRVIEENPDLAQIMRAGVLDLSQLSLDERIRFNANMMTRFRHHENLYYQYRTGMLDEREFEGFRRLFSWHLSFAGTAAWWTGARGYYSHDFAAYVGSLLESGAKEAGETKEESAPHLP
jgi:hypothetical protein